MIGEDASGCNAGGVDAGGSDAGGGDARRGQAGEVDWNCRDATDGNACVDETVFDDTRMWM